MTRQEARQVCADLEGQNQLTSEQIAIFKEAILVLSSHWSIPE